MRGHLLKLNLPAKSFYKLTLVNDRSHADTSENPATPWYARRYCASANINFLAIV
jgi:hypothetical protein